MLKKHNDCEHDCPLYKHRNLLRDLVDPRPEQRCPFRAMEGTDLSLDAVGQAAIELGPVKVWKALMDAWKEQRVAQ